MIPPTRLPSTGPSPSTHARRSLRRRAALTSPGRAAQRTARRKCCGNTSGSHRQRGRQWDLTTAGRRGRGEGGGGANHAPRGGRTNRHEKRGGGCAAAELRGAVRSALRGICDCTGSGGSWATRSLRKMRGEVLAASIPAFFVRQGLGASPAAPQAGGCPHSRVPSARSAGTMDVAEPGDTRACLPRRAGGRPSPKAGTCPAWHARTRHVKYLFKTAFFFLPSSNWLIPAQMFPFLRVIVRTYRTAFPGLPLVQRYSTRHRALLQSQLSAGSVCSFKNTWGIVREQTGCWG